MSKPKLALFGLGRAGKIHFKAANTNSGFLLLIRSGRPYLNRFQNLMRSNRCELAYIIEPLVEAARSHVALYPQCQAQILAPEQAETALGDPQLAGVIIASLTYTHEAIIRAAFAHQLPVFTEKPIAESADATMALCQEAERLRIPFLCAFNRRFDANFWEVKQRLAEVGETFMIKSSSRDHPSVVTIDYIKISGGQFLDHSVHDVDMCCWLAGERPSLVHAIGHAFYPDFQALEVPDTDTVMIQLQFPSGKMASIDNSRRATFGYDCRLEIYGDKGQLRMDNVYPSTVTLQDATGEHRGLMHTHFIQRFEQAYANELEHFIDFLAAPDRAAFPLRITPTEAYVAVRVAQAAMHSYRNKAPVHLTWD